MGATASASDEGASSGCYKEGRPCDGGLFEQIKTTLKGGHITAQNVCCEGGNDFSFETINSRHVYEASLSAMAHDERDHKFLSPDIVSSWAPSVVIGGQVLPAPSRSLGNDLGANLEFVTPSGQPLEAAKDDRYPDREGYERLVKETRAKMVMPEKDAVKGPPRAKKPQDASGQQGKDLTFPNFLKGRDVPVLGLITPMTTSQSDRGQEVLSIARHSDVYRERFFNVPEMLEDIVCGGYIDVFREELNTAKAEALEMKTRPRVIIGGDDTTTSIAIWLILKALQANEQRAADGLTQFKDTGNGFIWTDDELKNSFPAIAQLPLSSQNNLSDACGWSSDASCFNCCSCGSRRKAPAAKSAARSRSTCCGNSKSARIRSLLQCMQDLIDPTTPICNFDVWGIMPPYGAEKLNFKLCELGAKNGRTPKTKVKGKGGHIALKVPTGRIAKAPASWLVFLHFSAGHDAYVRSRCKANPHSSSVKSALERWRQSLGVICEKTPSEMRVKTNGIKVECLGGKGGDCLDHGEHHQAQSYFPPRMGKKKTWGLHCWSRGDRYREVGFYNVSCNAFSGAERAPLSRRLCFSGRRRTIRFNDGSLHMYRMRLKSYFKNPGSKMQTDKRKDMNLHFEASPGKGLFIQFDGESRFAFSPTGERIDLLIRKVINLPVVVGPSVKEPVIEERKVEFDFVGDTKDDKEQSRLRMLKSLNGTLDVEIHANANDILSANLPLYEPPPTREQSAGTFNKLKKANGDAEKPP